MTHSLVTKDVTDVLDRHSIPWANFSYGLYAYKIETQSWVKIELITKWLNNFLGE